MTPGLDPLMCSCGKHSARLQAAGVKKRNWEVFEVIKQGSKPRRVTMRAEKMSARCVVIDLCKGVHRKKNQPTATVTATAAVTRDLRHKDSRNASYAEATARASRVAGPGSGHKGKRVTEEDAVSEAERVLKKSKPTQHELHHALARITEEHKLLRRCCDKVDQPILLIVCRIPSNCSSHSS